MPTLKLNSKLSNVVFWLVLLLCGFMILRYQLRLLNYFEWGDESETIVTAKMMASGFKLFSEVFNMHGPLSFLPSMVLEKFGSFGIAGHRSLIIALQWLALASIYFSPMLNFTHRLIRVCLVFVLASVYVIYLPDFFGHTYLYQVIAGLLLVILLSQYTFPAIATPDKLGKNRIFWGNFLIACLPFLAITFIPAAALLFFASFRQSQFKSIALGIVAGLIFNVVFLLLYGSIPGFYAIHYYLNIQVLPQMYYSQVSGMGLVFGVYKAITGDLAHFIIVISMVLALARLAKFEAVFPVRSILILLALLSLLVRGSGLQGTPFLYPALMLPILFFDKSRTINYRQCILMALLMCLCFVRISAHIEWDKWKLNQRQVPKVTAFSDLVKRITVPGDRILVYSSHNAEYIIADRLPASGNFFYFPWQAKYYEKPILGIEIDSCQDIKQNKPKIILNDMWNPMESVLWNTYATCIQAAIEENYYLVKGTNWWIRKDIFPADLQREEQK